VETTVLDVLNCSFSYTSGAFELGDVSLGARSGEVLGLVGPSGSVKSTLLRVMSGFLHPDEGDVLLDGTPLRSFSRRDLAMKLAFLPQSPESSFRFSVRQVVAMGRFPYQGAFGFLSARDLAIVEASLEETGASPLGNRDFLTLSAGEKQQVLVAGILAQEPSVMLLDEPTAALDIHHRAEVFDLLWRLSRKGIAVVIVTHDLNSAAQFCDRLVLLSRGRVLRGGTPADVIDEDLLRSVYGADVRVVWEPVTQTPMVVVPGKKAHEAN